MARERVPLTGQKFGKLTVGEEAPRGPDGRQHYLCVCDCGKRTTVARPNLQSGNTKSCGCLSKRPRPRSQQMR